ncbi:MAG: MobP2 family relaxase [Lachnospiraceae bacterium]
MQAGVIIKQDFCRPESKVFSGYIDYMDRPEVKKESVLDEFTGYVDYMDRPEAKRERKIITYDFYDDYGEETETTGLFSKDKDDMSYSEKKNLKEQFIIAQANKSMMWRTVLSFDTQWLEENHLYDKEQGILDDRKLKEAIRLGVNRMLQKEGLSLAIWSGEIHYNTQHIHVHIAAVEPEPTRIRMEYKGNLEHRGKFEQKNIDLCRSSVINQIVQSRDVNFMINKIIRKDIVAAKKERLLANDPELRKSFLELYEALPQMSMNLQNYNNNIMHPYRELIDKISQEYIDKYHQDDYKKLGEILNSQSQLYGQAYGITNRNFEVSKKAELMERLGNAVLKEVKEYGKVINDISGKALEPKLPEENEYAQTKLGFEYLKGDDVPRNLTVSKEWFTKAAEQDNDQAKNILANLSEWTGCRNRRGMPALDKALVQLRKSLNEEYRNTMKNIREYDWELDKGHKAEQVEL